MAPSHGWTPCEGMGSTHTPLRKWFSVPTRVHNPSDQFSRFCRAHDRDRQTDRPTDRPRYSVCSNRPHLHSLVLQRGLLMLSNVVTDVVGRQHGEGEFSVCLRRKSAVDQRRNASVRCRHHLDWRSSLLNTLLRFRHRHYAGMTR